MIRKKNLITQTIVTLNSIFPEFYANFSPNKVWKIDNNKYLDSREELLETIYEHLHCILALEELNVRCSPNKSVQIVICDAEIDIYPVEHILWQVLEYVLGHLDVDIAFGLVTIRSIADLNPG